MHTDSNSKTTCLLLLYCIFLSTQGISRRNNVEGETGEEGEATKANDSATTTTDEAAPRKMAYVGKREDEEYRPGALLKSDNILLIRFQTFTDCAKMHPALIIDSNQDIIITDYIPDTFRQKMKRWMYLLFYYI